MLSKVYLLFLIITVSIICRGLYYNNKRFNRILLKRPVTLHNPKGYEQPSLLSSCVTDFDTVKYFIKIFDFYNPLMRSVRVATKKVYFQSDRNVEVEMEIPENENPSGLKLGVLLLNLGGPESMAVSMLRKYHRFIHTYIHTYIHT